MFDISRQPLVPAFLTLLPIVIAAVCCADLSVQLPGPAFDSARELAVTLPGDLLTEFQRSHPLVARIATALLLIYAALAAGRMSVRYNLYSAATCLAIPLHGIYSCGIALHGQLLVGAVAVTLLTLAAKYFARAFCNGYGFDAVFRASFCTGLLPLLLPAAWPLLLLTPLALVLFRRTVREAVVAASGLLLPFLVFCYIGWGAGGSLLAPAIALAGTFTLGTPFALIGELPGWSLALFATIGSLNLLAVLFFRADAYSVGTKARFVLIFVIGMLLLTAAVFALPAATRGCIALLAVPSALLAPFLFVRIHRAFSLPLYLLLAGAALAGIVLQ